MSLLRQLWIVVALSSLLAFAGGFVVNLTTAKRYVEQQLLTQGTDNAASLALSMSQQSKDAATIELMVSALFDSGHFRLIRFEDVHGKTVLERISQENTDTVPAWFTRMVPLKVEAGTGLVSDGWKQAGRVVVLAHERFAYQALWQGSLDFMGVMLLTFVLSGIAVTALIRWVRQPLHELVRQAEAISERHFLTITEPNVTELRRVVRTMNLMVERVKTMFHEQAARIEELRGAANRDGLTGLPNRDHFMGRLRQTLSDEGAAANGALLLLRLYNLTAINRQLGRNLADEYIRKIAQCLQNTLPADQEWLIARLNGADFAILAPGADQNTAQEQAIGLLRALESISMAGFTEDHNIGHIGIAFFQRGTAEGNILSVADQALAQAEAKGANSFALGNPGTQGGISIVEWQGILQDAITRKSFELASYPVLRIDGTLLHRELLLRLKRENGELMTAGQFMPMAARFSLLAALDLAAIELACERLQQDHVDLAVNISSASITTTGFLDGLQGLLKRYRSVSNRLWFEVNEFGLDGDYERLSAFAALGRSMECKIGIEHFGRQFGRIPALYDLRLDYIKIDGSFIRDIEQQPGNQQLVKAIVGISGGAGVLVLAEAVHSEAEWNTLRDLGVAGATGPLATRKEAAIT